MIKKIFNKIKTIGKPLTVHTEMIQDDEVWEKIKEKVKNNRVHTWYLITPINADIFFSFFRIPIGPLEYEKKLIERYLWLKKKKQNIQLHVHLSKYMKNLVYWQQELLIKKAIQWFEENLGSKVTELVPGWWKYNKDTEDILHSMNIKLIKRYDFKDCHDYDWIE